MIESESDAVAGDTKTKREGEMWKRETDRETDRDRQRQLQHECKEDVIGRSQMFLPMMDSQQDRWGSTRNFFLFVCLFVFRGIYKNWRLNWLTGPLLLNRFTSSVINEGNTKFGNKIPLECLVVFLSVVVFFLSFSLLLLLFFKKMFDKERLAMKGEFFFVCFQVANERKWFGFGHNARFLAFCWTNCRGVQ